MDSSFARQTVFARRMDGQDSVQTPNFRMFEKSGACCHGPGASDRRGSPRGGMCRSVANYSFTEFGAKVERGHLGATSQVLRRSCPRPARRTYAEIPLILSRVIRCPQSPQSTLCRRCGRAGRSAPERSGSSRSHRATTGSRDDGLRPMSARVRLTGSSLCLKSGDLGGVRPQHSLRYLEGAPTAARWWLAARMMGVC